MKRVIADQEVRAASAKTVDDLRWSIARERPSLELRMILRSRSFTGSFTYNLASRRVARAVLIERGETV